jgi:hypothetical protein
MSFQQWQAALLPKVQGTWNLHHELEKYRESVDFFFFFSSTGAITGQWEQSNYNAGNTFLDAFVQYRHSLGLPASVVNIGVVEDIGYVSENPDVLNLLRATSQCLFQEQELLDSIELMIKRSKQQCAIAAGKENPNSPSSRYVNTSQVGIGMRSVLPLSLPSNRIVWRADPRRSVYRNLEHQDAGSDASIDCDTLSQFLKDISSNMTLLRSPEAVTLLAQEIGKTLFGFMMRSDEDVDLQAPLQTLGIDSLISIELRNWTRRKLKAEFSVLEIIRSPV